VWVICNFKYYFIQAKQLKKTAYIAYIAEINVEYINKLYFLCADKIGEYEEIYLSVSSPGGSTQIGLNSYNFLSSLPIKIITHAVGNVDSAALSLFFAGEKRMATHDTTFNIHRPVVKFNNDDKFNEDSLLERLNILKNEKEKILNLYTLRSQNKNFRFCQLLNEGAVLNTEQAINLNIISDVCELPNPLDEKISFIGPGF
jgi:ATP-dependent protease ClpP protease subunit